jgi:hypothetical protein
MLLACEKKADLLHRRNAPVDEQIVELRKACNGGVASACCTLSDTVKVGAAGWRRRAAKLGSPCRSEKVPDWLKK